MFRHMSPSVRVCRTFAERSPYVSPACATVGPVPDPPQWRYILRPLRTIVPLALVTVAVAAPATAAAAPAGAAAAREFEGTVVSVNRDNRTFRLRDSERGTIRIKVNRNTRFERVSGLGGLSAGMRNIEATVRRS